MHSFLLWLLPTNHKVAIQPEPMTNVYRIDYLPTLGVVSKVKEWPQEAHVATYFT